VLACLGVEPIRIADEQREMEPFAFGRTSNRRVLGTLNEFMFQLSWYLRDNPAMSLLEASLKLALNTVLGRTRCLSRSSYFVPVLGRVVLDLSSICALTVRSNGRADAGLERWLALFRRAGYLEP
jgi:hypothetical protein